MIWRRSDRPEQMWLEWATTASFSNLTRVCGRYYEQIRKLGPDFFLHSGDTIYADDPLQAQGNLADGTRWNNVVTEEWSDNWSDIQRRQR